MKNLYENLGEMTHDGLITAMTPATQIGCGTIAKGTAVVTYARGTAFAKSTATGLLSILGTAADTDDTLTPDCILCEDTEVTADANSVAAVFTAGCFDPNKIILATDYELTAADLDALRCRNIICKAAMQP